MKDGSYEAIGSMIGELCDKKQSAYGDSVGSSADFLRMLWPEGIPVDAYGELQIIIRIFDKFKRLATDPMAFGENPWADITGYGMLGYKALAERKLKEE